MSLERMMMILAGAALASLVSCAEGNGKSDETSAAKAAVKQPTVLKAKPASAEPGEETKPVTIEDVLGSWQNGSCGTRKYTRNITLFSDNRFEAADLIAPCPPEVRCVWSGVISWRGTFTFAEDRVTLKTETEPSDQIRGAGGWPKSFAVLPGTPPTVAETSPDGMTCPYRKAP